MAPSSGLEKFTETVATRRTDGLCGLPPIDHPHQRRRLEHPIDEDLSLGTLTVAGDSGTLHGWAYGFISRRSDSPVEDSNGREAARVLYCRSYTADAPRPYFLKKYAGVQLHA